MERTKKPPLRNVEERNHLVEENMGLVHAMVSKHRDLPRVRHDRVDAVGEGIMALIRAAAGWDPARKVRFSTYACASIFRAIRERKAQEILEASFLQPPVNRDGEEWDWVEDRRQVASVQKRGEWDDPALCRAWRTLQPRDQDIVLMRLDGISFDDIASMVDLSRKQVSRIWDKSIYKLRFKLTGGGLGMRDGRKSRREHFPIGTRVIRLCHGSPRWKEKVSETGLNQWHLVASIVWKDAGREIPPGKVLGYANGDSLDDRLENLQLQPRRRRR